MIFGNSEKIGMTEEMLDLVGVTPWMGLPAEEPEKKAKTFKPIEPAMSFIGLIPIPG